MNGERMAGGMIQLSEQMGDVPPNWMVYFSVADCDASVDKAKSLGANVLVPPSDIPEVGRFSTMCDPQGAAFSVIHLKAPQAN